MSEFRYARRVLVVALLLTAGLFGLSLTARGQREITPLENIHGIPYPAARGSQIITEELAHADIFLKETVLAKQLTLTITFRPGHLQKLAVGIRENEFWLSYQPTPLYNHATPANAVMTRVITVPLTDKLQQTDRSLDLMFFAEGLVVDWEVLSLQADVTLVRPSGTEFKDYLRSVMKKERAL